MLAMAGVCAAENGRPSSASSGLENYPDEYVVITSSSPSSQGKVRALAAEANLSAYGTVTRHLGSGALVLNSARRSGGARSPSKLSTLSARLGFEDRFCKDLLARKVVSACSPNYALRAAEVVSSDPLTPNMWGLSIQEGVAASSAWDITTGSRDVVVAVIDTGIDYNHPDLAANIWTNPGEVPANGIDDDGNGIVDDVHGANFVSGTLRNGDPYDDSEHGTHVAGVIGAALNNGVGGAGVSPQVSLMALKFMDAQGVGRLSDAIAAINYMVDLKVNRGVNVVVSNNSWGGGAFSAPLAAAIEGAKAAGIVFIAAAGNAQQDVDLFPSYPSSYESDNVVAVGAVGRDGKLASFSNFGSEGVDIAAPGVDILSTAPGGSYKTLSGTSMATPFVSGALALLFAIEPSISMADAINRLYETGRKNEALYDAEQGRALLRTQRLVDVSRLVRNERVALPPVGDGLPACGYDFQLSNLVRGGAIDTAADSAPIVNQQDEEGYYSLTLPFEFPFFRATTRRVYISPNGVVYLHKPGAPDYQVAARAPNFSVAALHTDLTPRSAKEGVRVKSAEDRVTIMWRSEHYALSGQGQLTIRLTLYKSGVIRDSISFDAAADPVEMRRLVFGNPFSAPATAALGLIGISGASQAASNTVDLGASQLQLLSSGQEALHLGVAMVPTCITVEDAATPALAASVSRLRVKLSSDRRRIHVQLFGAGSGQVAVTASLDNRLCNQTGWVSLVNGRGGYTLRWPPGATRLTLKSGSARKRVALSGVARRLSRSGSERLCSQLLRSVIPR